jgi:hypothetical protein
MDMTAQDLEQTLTIIEARAKGLRAAGITGRVSVGDVHFELEAAGLPLVPVTTSQATEVNALDDAETYGGLMPKRRERQPEDEVSRGE